MKVRLKGGEIIDVQCQQYQIGLYVCIYGSDGRMKDQFGLDTTQKQFIEDLKNNRVFEGKYIEDGAICL